MLLLGTSTLVRSLHLQSPRTKKNTRLEQHLSSKNLDPLVEPTLRKLYDPPHGVAKTSI